MATIIDELIIQLGLDPTKFKQGEKEAIDSLRKLEEGAGKTGKNVERHVGGMEQSFGLLQKRLLSVAGLFLGGLGIEQFVRRVTELNVATLNLAGNLGVSTQNLRAWQMTAERFGLSPGAVNAGFGVITAQRARGVNLHENTPLERFANWVNAGTTRNKLNIVDPRGPGLIENDEEIAMRLSRWLANETKAGRGVNARAALRDTAGLPEEFVTLLARGPEALRKLTEEAKKLAPSSEDVKRFDDLNRAFHTATQSAQRLGEILTAMIAPELIQDFESLSNMLQRTMRTLSLLRQGKYSEAFQNEMYGSLKDQVQAKEKELQHAMNPDHSVMGWLKGAGNKTLQDRLRKELEDLRGRYRASPEYAGDLRDQIREKQEKLKDLQGQEPSPEVLNQQRALEAEIRKLREEFEKLNKRSENQPQSGGVQPTSALFGPGFENSGIIQAMFGGGSAGGGVRSAMWSGGGAENGGYQGGNRSGGEYGHGDSGAPGTKFDLDLPKASNADLAADRARFAEEFKKDPEAFSRWIATAANEDYPSTPAGRKQFRKVLEETLNRASMRGVSARRESRWTSEGGYYEGRPHWQILRDQKNLEIAKKIAAEVLAGSNESNYATDNSSQGLSEREASGGKFELRSAGPDGNSRVGAPGVESFFAPGPGGGSEGRGGRAKYEAWRRRIHGKGGVATTPLPRPRPTAAPDMASLIDRAQMASLAPGDMRHFTHQMTVGDVHVHTAATDSQGIASSIKPALLRYARVMAANNGPA